MMEIPLNPILMMKKDHVFPLYQYYKEMAYVPVLPLAPAMSITRSYFFLQFIDQFLVIGRQKQCNRRDSLVGLHNFFFITIQIDL